jgi:putative CocE/NonD family hydrolase
LVCLALARASVPVPYAKLLGVHVAMRDNARLDTNVFYPVGGGRFPVILLRTPYGKGSELPAGYQSFINHGYAVVMQDVRGRYASGGNST